MISLTKFSFFMATNMLCGYLQEKTSSTCLKGSTILVKIYHTKTLDYIYERTVV